MELTVSERWTVARFLAWEDKQEGRYEFDGARAQDMPGGSRGHQRIISNLIRFLEDTLDPARFDAVPGMRLQVGGRVRYPDVAVVAGRVRGSERALYDALILFEVVSKDTEAVDRLEKRAEYAGVPMLSRYVIVEQGQPAATVLTRIEGGWSEESVSSALKLPELGIIVPLPAVYRGVRFD